MMNLSLLFAGGIAAGLLARLLYEAVDNPAQAKNPLWMLACGACVVTLIIVGSA